MAEVRSLDRTGWVVLKSPKRKREAATGIATDLVEKVTKRLMVKDHAG